jgi:hypothetical protein
LDYNGTLGEMSFLGGRHFSNRLLGKFARKPRKGVQMKKYGVLLLVGLLALGACASLPRAPISSGDLPSLKGKWEGERDMTWGRYRSYDPAFMEIFNDTIPLKGKVAIQFMDEAQLRTYSFEDGTIDSEGNFRAQLKEDTKIILSLKKGGNKMRLDGDYLYGNYRGRLTVDKK